MPIRLLCAHLMTTYYVGNIPLRNSKRLRRKIQKMLRDYFLSRPVYTECPQKVNNFWIIIIRSCF